MTHPIILASASPRRREILEQVGIPFTVIPSTKEEIITTDIPEEAVKSLAFQKAADVKQKADSNAVIIGADTIVVHNHTILGKPKNKDEAISMLTSLQGDTHQVFTGVAILHEEKEFIFSVETKVTVLPMTLHEIESYVNTDNPMDKAGAYGIQGQFARYIKEISGDYYNVVGFPISSIYAILKKITVTHTPNRHIINPVP